MPITSGSYTIGSGGDYADIRSFRDDITTQTAGLTGIVISDLTETSATVFDHDNSTYDFSLFTSGNYVITNDHSSHTLLFNLGGSGNVKVYNNILYNNPATYYAIVTSGACIVENNTIYTTVGNGIDGDSTASIIRNNAIIASTCFSNIATNVSGYNNATNDTTGEDGDFATGQYNISNIQTSAEFISLDPNNPDFLKPRFGERLWYYGTSATLSTSGIDNNPRPTVDDNGDTYYSIGAHQWDGNRTLYSIGAYEEGQETFSIGAYEFDGSYVSIGADEFLITSASPAVIIGTMSRMGEILGIKSGFLYRGSRLGTILGIKGGIR